MSATKAQILRAIDGYKEAIFADVERRCEDYCEELVWSAVKYRMTAPNSHNFTGNLLNSIVVCLYKNRVPKAAWFAADRFVQSATHKKMTYPRKYFFSKNADYDGQKSFCAPNIDTDQGWGKNDAVAFFRSYKPKGKNLFDIVVAYPTEYAEWVEIHRGTVGVLNAYSDAKMTGTTFLRLPQK